jgi:hypothetical protein
MKRGVFAAIGASAAALLLANSAAAATSLVSPPCTLSVGTSCLFSGNLTLQLTGNNSLGAADDAYNGQSPTPSPLLNLAGMANMVDVTSGFGSNQTSGMVTSSFLVSFYAVKAGDFFDLFEIAPSTTFNWSTSGISVGSGQTPAISHLLYFGGGGSTRGGGVPEPASWAMMIAGLGAVGAAMRMRGKTAIAAG